MTCPSHNLPLVEISTSYGPAWKCTEDGCTVLCWNGSTSTPADDETRTLRHKCHLAFDPLWKRKSRFRSRGEAYRWLKREMGGIEHIGHMTAEECRQLLGKLAEDEA